MHVALVGSTWDLDVELFPEPDGRWQATIPQIPGLKVYADTEAEAVARAQVFALRWLADRLAAGLTP